MAFFCGFVHGSKWHVSSYLPLMFCYDCGSQWILETDLGGPRPSDFNFLNFLFSYAVTFDSQQPCQEGSKVTDLSLFFLWTSDFINQCPINFIY